MAITTYSTQELGEIQAMIAGKRKLNGTEIDAVKAELPNIHKSQKGYLFPFVGLYATNPDLYKKLLEDDLVSQYSLFGFFPETFGLVYGSDNGTEISLDHGTRGLVGIVKNGTKEIVVKPIQSSREQEIAKIASELEVGPRQLPSLKGYITEGFVEGELFSRLRGDRASEEEMYKIGRRVGEILTKLHVRGIYYNDTILSDDMGRSHVIVPENSPAILFDYGVALDVNKHPNFSDEEVFDFARTLPEVSMFLEIPTSPEQYDEIVQRYRPQLAAATKEQIMDRDRIFVGEGLWLGEGRIGKSISGPFSKGFSETYKR